MILNATSIRYMNYRKVLEKFFINGEVFQGFAELRYNISNTQVDLTLSKRSRLAYTNPRRCQGGHRKCPQPPMGKMELERVISECSITRKHFQKQLNSNFLLMFNKNFLNFHQQFGFFVKTRERLTQGFEIFRKDAKIMHFFNF